jgi:hypothetical protein
MVAARIFVSVGQFQAGADGRKHQLVGPGFTLIRTSAPAPYASNFRSTNGEVHRLSSSPTSTETSGKAWGLAISTVRKTAFEL